MRMPSFSRNVWLRASSSNRDMLEVHLDAATRGVIRHVMGSCMDSSKVAGAKLLGGRPPGFLPSPTSGKSLVDIYSNLQRKTVVQLFLWMHEDLPDRGCFFHGTTQFA